MLLDFDVKQPVDETNLYDCRINSIAVLLSYYHFPFSKNDILLLSESLTFLYCRINLENIGAANVPFVVASEDHLEDRLFEKLQITYCTEKIDDSTDGWSHIKDLLQQKTPILVKMDDRVLKLEKKPAHEEMIRLRFLSLPLLTGYSDAEDSVFAFWTNSKSFYYPMQMQLSDFQHYRTTDILPFSPDQTCVYIQRCKPEKRDSYKKLIHKSVYSIAKKMLSGVSANPVDLQTVQGHDCEVGISAIRTLEHDLVSLGKKELFFAEKTEQKKVLFILMLIRSTLLNGSFSAFREEYGNALCEFGESENAEPLCRIGAQLKDASRQWKELIALLSKAPHTNHFRRIYIQICIQLNRIYKTEKKAFGDIIAYYESL